MDKKPDYKELEFKIRQLEQELARYRQKEKFTGNTEHHLEKNLKKSEARYRSIFEHTKNGVAIYKTHNGEDFIFVDFNASAERIDSIKKESVIGKNVLEIFPEIKTFGLFDVFQRVWKTGKSERHPICLYKDERIVGWRDNFVYKLPSSEIVAVYTDETERMQAVASLRESEEKYRALVENSPDIIIRFDREGRHLFVNRSIENILNFQTDEFIGKTHRELGFPENECQFWEQHIQSVFESKKGVEIEFKYKGKKGVGNYNWRVLPEFDEYKEVKSILCIVRDITEYRRAEQNYRSVFNQMLGGFVIHEIISDDTGKPVNYRFLIVNPSFERMFGLNADAVIGKTITEILPNTESYWLEAYEKVAMAGEPLQIENYYRELDKYVEVVVFRPQKGQLACIFLDMTRRKTAEEELRKSKKQLSGILNSISDGFFTLDNELVITYFNKAAEQLLGRNSKDVIGYNIFEAFPESKGSVFEDKFTQAVREKKVILFETYFGIQPYENWYDVRVYPFENGISVYFRIVTESKRAEIALRESIELFRTTFERASIGMCLISIEGRLLMVNHSLCEMIGYAEEELISKKFTDITHPDDMTLSFKNMQLLLDGKQDVIRFEKRYVHKNGHSVWVIIGIFLLRDDNDNPRHFITHVQDITHTKKLESQLRQAQKMEAIGTLAGGIAHDFNNILFPIMGYAEMTMMEMPEDSTAYKHLHAILKASVRARELVHQILTFSRQYEHTSTPLNIPPIVKEVLKLLQSTLPATIEIRQDIKKSCGPVLADPTQIHQVVMNLCTNAYHAMRENGGILKLTLDEIEFNGDDVIPGPGMEPGLYLRLMVSDTGIGMDRNTVERIFDPYFTTKIKGEGTGLGLSIVHGIVRNIGGCITVYSEPDKGTTFRVYLPRIRLEDPSQKIISDKPIIGGDEHILLVDDEKDAAEMLQHMLEKLGYRITVKNSSTEALEIFQNSPDDFNLVITDMTMPQMTGIKLSQKLMETRPHVPIVLCTGFSEMIDEEKAKAIGIQEFIMKPVLRRDLAEAIRRALDKV